MKPFKHIIAIDPSGAYYEGKGTTGVCFFNCIEGRAQEFDTICARAYDSDVAYWDAHIGILEKFVKRSKNPCVVIEDYLLYAAKADSQINSRMETCQLIGILKHWCATHHIPYRMQPAVAVKQRWNKTILIHEGYLFKNSHNQLQAGMVDRKLTEHELDAMRHAVHTHTFYNKGDRKVWQIY